MQQLHSEGREQDVMFTLHKKAQSLGAVRSDKHTIFPLFSLSSPAEELR
jgi:hypothetical protein